MSEPPKVLSRVLWVVVPLAFLLILTVSVIVTLDPPKENPPSCPGALAGGCIVGLAILLHGAMVRGRSGQ